MEVVFGVYLGNSTCSVAVNKENNVEVVANPGGDRVTPAVVAIHDDEMVTGVSAKQGMLRYGARTILGVLRHISATDLPQSGSGNTCAPTVAENGDVSYTVQTDSNSKTITALNILKQIFLELKDISSQHHAASQNTACLCLPAWVTDRAVAITREAAIEAGFRIVTVVLQPTAACLAYNLIQDRSQSRLVLSLHLGESSGVGSVLEVSGGLVTVKDTVSTVTAPGVTLTNKLVDYLAKEFYKKYRGDCLENKRSRQKLYNQAETVKHVLSTRPTAQVNVDSLWEGVDFSCQVSRARFEGLITSTLTEMLTPILEMMEKLGIQPDQIEKVVLSGGTCKMPRLKEIVSETFPTAEVLSSIPPDEVLAYGAAIEARAVTCLNTDSTDTTAAAAAAGGGVVVANGLDDNDKENEKENKNGKKKKKKRPQNERRKQEVLRCHLPVLVSALSIPVWCKISKQASVCALARLSPPLLRNTFTLPLGGSFDSKTKEITVTFYEATKPCDGNDEADHEVPEAAILAQIVVPVTKKAKELNMSCQLKPDGSLHLTALEPVSKLTRKFVVCTEEEGDSN